MLGRGGVSKLVFYAIRLVCFTIRLLLSSLLYQGGNAGGGGGGGGGGIQKREETNQPGSKFNTSCDKSKAA